MESTSISKKWNEYFEQNSIVNFTLNIKQKKISCKKIASKIKRKFLWSALVWIIIIITISVFAVNYVAEWLGIFGLIVIPLLGESIKTLFTNYESIIKENAKEVIKILEPETINLKKLTLQLGTVALYRENSITDSIEEDLLGYVCFQVIDKEKGKLIILDKTTCTIFATKEFYITDIKKFTIKKLDDKTTEAEIDSLRRAADNARTRSSIESLQPSTIGMGGTASLATSVKMHKLANEKLDKMNKLYILFDDNSQLWVSNLDDNAKMLHQFLKKENGYQELAMIANKYRFFTF